MSRESTDHLLLHHVYVHHIWTLVFCMFGAQWVMPRKVVDLLNMYVWRTPIQRYMGGHSSFYYVDNWKEQNRRTFEGTEGSLPELKLVFLRLLNAWMAALISHSFSSLEAFLDLCNFC